MMYVTLVSILLPLCGAAWGADFPIQDASRLELNNAKVESVNYKGKPGLKIREKEPGPGQPFAGLKDVQFHNGTIDLEVSGAPSATAEATARGFIGVAFRIQADGVRYEEIYLRPSNGRAEDQEQRNHATQYVSAPDWPWNRLRKETPGRYESYVDLQAGETAPMRSGRLGQVGCVFACD